jgi:addiction module HigA family antidote
MASTHSFNPGYASPPGDTLHELIEERGISQTELADRTGLARKTINEIIQGKAPLTTGTAQKLEMVLQTPAQFWNERERLYRQRLALKDLENELKKHLGWEKHFPYTELAKRGLVSATGNALHRIWNLCCFFQIAQPESIDKIFGDLTISGILFRRQTTAKPKEYLAWTWLRVAEIEAQKIEDVKFSSERFLKCIREVPGRTVAVRDGQSLNKFISETKESFRTAGVALVLVPEFAGAAINGAAFWQGERPVIALTLRGKRLDSLVFTLLHEAAHILHHGKRLSVIDAGMQDELGKKQDAIEQGADACAAAWCIAKELDSRIRGVRAMADIDGLSSEIKVHRDLIIGRYAKLTGNYKRFSSQKLRLKWE